MTHPSVLEKRSLPEESSVPFEMACPHRAATATDGDCWTAASLLSALLELLIAFLFLAGATISYLTFKLIRFFGLQPPCFDRGGTLPESRSNLQKIVPPGRLPTELCTPSHCCLHEKHLKNCERREPHSPFTPCSQFDSHSPLERIRRDQLSFTCRRCTPQLVRKRSNCVRSFDSKHQETTNFEVIATAEDKGCDICPCCCHGHCSVSGGSIRRRLRRTKKRQDGVVLDDCLDLCGGSDDDSIAGSEADGVRQMERERNFKVFPEDLIDFHSWNQENEGNGFVKSSQDTIAHRQFSGADSIHAPETSIQHCPEKQETRVQLTGEYLGLPTEPLLPEVEYEGARGPIRSSDFCSAEEQSASKAVEPGYSFGNGFEDVGKPVSLLSNGNLIDYITTPGEEVLKNSWGGVDDDSNELKEKLALERETLNRVYLELEKERTASASAADEAMAMITKLQKDKAALQLEAVQYQRMAEEKALCDEDAIVVLRDFLLKREAEKLCLEEEIEFYKSKFSTSRSKSAKRRERRDETGDALLCEEPDKDTCPLMKPKDFEGNAAFDAVPDDQRVRSYGALSGHRTSLFSAKADTLLEPSNPPARQDNPSSIHSSGDRSPKTGKDANDEDQNNDFQAAACHDRPYSPAHANGHEIRPGTPKDREDANDEDHCDDFHAAALHCKSHSSMRVNGHEIRSGKKSRGVADRQWLHILERIWSLEEQIHRLKTKHNLSVELSLGAPSGHGMKQRPSKEKRKTLDHKLSQNNSPAKRSVGHRKFGTNDHGKRLMRANESRDGVSSTSSETGMHNLSIANGTPAFVSLTMDSAEEIERGIQASSETTEQIEVPDAFFEPLMETETSTQVPSVTTASPLFCSSLEPECLIQDERTAEDEVNNDSGFPSTEVSRISLSDVRATITGSESNTALKTEVQEFVSRLQELEADREAMREVMESMRKQRERKELLEIGAQELLLQEREGSAVCEEAAETCQPLQDDSSIEAERSAEKEQCFSRTSSEELLVEDTTLDAGSCVDGPLLSDLEPHA